MEERISFGSGLIKFGIEAGTIIFLFENTNIHWYLEWCAWGSIVAIIASSIYYFAGDDDNPAWGRAFLALLIFTGTTFLLPAALIVLIVIAGIWLITQFDSGQAEKKKRTTVVEHYECSNCGHVIGKNNTRCPNCDRNLR